MQKVGKKSSMKSPPSDLAYWLAQPPEARFAAVELLRQQVHANRPRLNKDFKEFAGLFDSKTCEHQIARGEAFAAQGHPRNTGDIDIWSGASQEDASRVMEALQDFGFGKLGIAAADLLKPESVVQLGYPPARIDLLAYIDGVRFSDCYARRIVMHIDNVDLPVINVADFRTNKLAVGRLKDLADVEALDRGRDEK